MSTNGQRADSLAQVAYDGPYYTQFNLLGVWITAPLGKNRDKQDALDYAKSYFLENPSREIRVVNRKEVVIWDSESEKEERVE